MAENETAVYLFGFAKANTIQGLEGVGVDGVNPIFLHRYKEIAAIVGMVPVGDFIGESAEANMEDVSWIAPRAVRHEDILEEALRLSPIFPARFGTLFLSLANITEFMSRHHGTIAGFLDRVSGKEEWSVKAFLDREESKKAILASTLALRDDQQFITPGARYLREQRLRVSADRDIMVWVKDVTVKIWSELNGVSEDFFERKVLPNSARETGEEMILNWAFLMAEDDLERFQSIITKSNEEYAYAGLLFESSGPWPPYSFTPPLNDDQLR